MRTCILLRHSLTGLLAASVALGAWAHDFKAGAVVIDHPYAVPSAQGSNRGEVYFRALKNTGSGLDRLVGARTAAAAAVQIHQRSAAGASSPARVVGSLDLPAGREVRVRHDGEWVLLLTGLKSPLRKDDQFQLTLRFERAGEVEVPVHVVLPRPGPTGQASALRAPG